jgi:hypothetical protein
MVGYPWADSLSNLFIGQAIGGATLSNNKEKKCQNFPSNVLPVAPTWPYLSAMPLKSLWLSSSDRQWRLLQAASKRRSENHRQETKGWKIGILNEHMADQDQLVNVKEKIQADEARQKDEISQKARLDSLRPWHGMIVFCLRNQSYPILQIECRTSSVYSFSLFWMSLMSFQLRDLYICWKDIINQLSVRASWIVWAQFVTDSENWRLSEFVKRVMWI